MVIRDAERGEGQSPPVAIPRPIQQRHPFRSPQKGQTQMHSSRGWPHAWHVGIHVG